MNLQKFEVAKICTFHFFYFFLLFLRAPSPYLPHCSEPVYPIWWAICTCSIDPVLWPLPWDFASFWAVRLTRIGLLPPCSFSSLNCTFHCRPIDPEADHSCGSPGSDVRSIQSSWPITLEWISSSANASSESSTPQPVTPWEYTHASGQPPCMCCHPVVIRRVSQYDSFTHGAALMHECTHTDWMLPVKWERDRTSTQPCQGRVLNRRPLDCKATALQASYFPTTIATTIATTWWLNICNLLQFQLKQTQFHLNVGYFQTHLIWRHCNWDCHTMYMMYAKTEQMWLSC